MAPNTERTGSEREYLKKIRSLEERLKKDPIPANYIALAKAYHKIRLFDHVIKILNKSLARYPSNVDAQYWLGRSYFDKGMVQVAQEILEGVVASIPHHLPSLKILGHIAYKQKETATAIMYYRKVLTLDPTQEEIQNILELLEEKIISSPTETVVERRPRVDPNDVTMAASAIQALESEFFAEPPPKAEEPPAHSDPREEPPPAAGEDDWEALRASRAAPKSHLEEDERLIAENLKTLSDWLKNVKREV